MNMLIPAQKFSGKVEKDLEVKEQVHRALSWRFKEGKEGIYCNIYIPHKPCKDL